MNTRVQIQQTSSLQSGAQLWRRVRAAAIHVRTTFAEKLIYAATSHMFDTAADSQRRQAAARDAQALRRAVYANSPSEIDWLLSAAIMTDPLKRRYCLERALALNPGSEPAMRALACLPA